MTDYELLRKRNNWVVIVFVGVISILQILNIIMGISLTLVFSILGIFGGVIVPVALIGNYTKYKDVLATPIKYFNLIIIGIFMLVVLTIDPHMINIMSMFFFVSVMGIYQDKWINTLTLITTLGILIYNFVEKGEIIFHSTNYSDLIYYILMFCFVSISSFLQSMFNKNLQKEVEIQKEEAIRSKTSIENMLVKINDSLISVKDYQTDLHKTTEDVNVKSFEIIESIKSIIESFDVQTKQSNELVSEMSSTNVKVEDMTISMQDMNNYLESTQEATSESGKRINNLANDLEVFNGTIHKTISFMEELHSETENIEKIIQTISDISAQTNLLALNASIEAARAGEQGKGFAVVANEVRKLAESSKESSESISHLLLAIRERISLVSDTISQSQASIDKNREGMEEVKAIFTDVDTYMESFTDKTKNLQEFILTVQAMMQEVEAKGEESVSMIDSNKQSLEDILELVSNQHKDISSLSDGFEFIQQKLQELNK